MEYNYEKEKKALISFTNNTRNVSSEKINNIEKEYPKTPKYFLSYLKNIGAGSIKNSSITIYDNLLDFSDFELEDIYDLPKNIKLFGDNFSGDFIGFDFDKNGEVIEFLHESGEIYWTGKNFKEYIKDLIESL